jgi:hypothetical protein
LTKGQVSVGGEFVLIFGGCANFRRSPLDYMVRRRYLKLATMYPLFFTPLAQINAEASLVITCFDECGDKKSQILKQQNLASEEGDEKLME